MEVEFVGGPLDGETGVLSSSGKSNVRIPVGAGTTLARVEDLVAAGGGDSDNFHFYALTPPVRVAAGSGLRVMAYGGYLVRRADGELVHA